MCYYCRKRIQAAQEKRERELREIEDKNLRDKLNKVEAQLKDRKDEIKLEATLKQVKKLHLLPHTYLIGFLKGVYFCINILVRSILPRKVRRVYEKTNRNTRRIDDEIERKFRFVSKTLYERRSEQILRRHRKPSTKMLSRKGRKSFEMRKFSQGFFQMRRISKC